MGIFFSRGKHSAKDAAKTFTPKLTPYEEAKIEVKRNRDRSTKLIKRLDHEIDTLLHNAKIAKGAGRNDTALNLLKMKKLKMNQRETVQAQLFNLEGLVSKMEEQETQVAVMKALEMSNKAMAEFQRVLPIEKAEAIMEDLDENLAYVNEIESIFTRQLGDHPNMEAELQADYDLLGVELASPVPTESIHFERLPQVPTSPPAFVMPVAPSTPSRVAVPA